MSELSIEIILIYLYLNAITVVKTNLDIISTFVQYLQVTDILSLELVHPRTSESNNINLPLPKEFQLQYGSQLGPAEDSEGS